MDAPVLERVEPAGDAIPEDPAEEQLRALYPHRPGMVRLGLIRSIDGRATGDDGSSRTLNGPEDLRILRTLRAVADVVVVGAETVRTEHYGSIRLPEPLIATRTSLRSTTPQLAIITRSGSVPDHLDHDSTWIVTSADNTGRIPAAWSDRVLVCGERSVNPEAVIEALDTRGMPRVLCEGGPSVARRFLDRGLIDEYCLTTSPERGGDDAPFVPGVPPSMRLLHRLAGGGFTIERWSSQR